MKKLGVCMLEVSKRTIEIHQTFLRVGMYLTQTNQTKQMRKATHFSPTRSVPLPLVHRYILRFCIYPT